jgi:hypothetical protein
MIQKLQYKIDIEQLQFETKKILDKYPVNEQNQICFQNTKPNLNDVYEGTGDARLPYCPTYNKPEKDFIYFNNEFKDTIFYSISQRFSGRMRLNVLPNKKCYRMHIDPNLIRYHFAIFTNDNCFILYKDKKHYHIPANGYCYKMDARIDHTALNAGKENRIHLVISNSLIL